MEIYDTRRRSQRHKIWLRADIQQGTEVKRDTQPEGILNRMESESTGHFGNISLLSYRTEIESQVFGSVLVAICITTLVGNGLVIAALLKSWHNTVTKPGNYLALHLALADVLNGLLTMAPCCVSFFATDWLFGDTMCKVSGFLLIFFTTSSNSFLSMISLNRYYRVKNPSVRGAALRRRAFFMTIVCWVSGLVTAMASASSWTRIVFVPGFDVNCMVVWDSSAKGLINMTFICSLLFCVPFSVMTVTYVQIFGLVRGRTATVEPDARVSTIARSESISVPANSSQSHRRNTLSAIQQFLWVIIPLYFVHFILFHFSSVLSIIVLPHTRDGMYLKGKTCAPKSTCYRYCLAMGEVRSTKF